MSKRFHRDPLIENARNAAGKAYAPYSRYNVGAAMELRAAGQTPAYISGCNIENASYGLSICAERSVVSRMIADGIEPSRIKRLAVSAKGAGYPRPCGACLQVLSEFFPDLEIVLDRGAGPVQRARLRKLLPGAFRLG